jgi:tRNA 2-selenouridine synthase SelU
MHIKIIIFCCLTTIILGCTVKEYEGIKIPYSIQIREDFLDRKVRNVIKSSLKYEQNALKDFIKLTDKVDGESSYDLGFVLTQIINRIGEQKFIELTKNLNSAERKLLKNYIEVGLEYGDNNHDGEVDNERIENVYKKINEIL